MTEACAMVGISATEVRSVSGAGRCCRDRHPSAGGQRLGQRQNGPASNRGRGLQRSEAPSPRFAWRKLELIVLRSNAFAGHPLGTTDQTGRQQDSQIAVPNTSLGVRRRVRRRSAFTAPARPSALVSSAIVYTLKNLSSCLTWLNSQILHRLAVRQAPRQPLDNLEPV